MNNNFTWKFIDDKGTFLARNADRINQIYFPLCNEEGMMSSITPNLNGDAKTGQNSFLYLPVSVEDLHNNRSSRNFWVYNKEKGAFSLTGNSARQRANKKYNTQEDSDVLIEGGFLYHKFYSLINEIDIASEITTFCPTNDDKVEINYISITNKGTKPISFVFTSAIPIFGRSADNLRDHRHATSMMHRVTMKKNGVLIKPTMHHDERGHEPNDTSYFVYGATGQGTDPEYIFPTVDEFIGQGGTLDWPETVVTNKVPNYSKYYRKDGMESIGAFRFQETTLEPEEKQEYILVAGITDENDFDRNMIKYNSSKKVVEQLNKNKRYWNDLLDSIQFKGISELFDGWIRWVELQPSLRKIFGCSFLPYHDYGRGGRGWRDLWQDLMALLLQNPENVRDILVNNFKGVRMDGSNATIILPGVGKFAADRNKISRVWMDHGVWPYFTIQLYINQTGDVSILDERIPYWKDHQCRRAKKIDTNWNIKLGNVQKTKSGKVYEGTVLEHILLQHLVCYYNLGEHGNIKLEDGDWNDQLDMASEKGETVPFTAFYGHNLVSLGKLIKLYKSVTKKNKVSLCKEMMSLLCDDTGLNIESKKMILENYFTIQEQGISDEKEEMDIDNLVDILESKGNSLLLQVRNNEWISTSNGIGFFNGYYNNDGKRVDGEIGPNEIRMGLTAQTFAILSGAATKDQINKVTEAVIKFLSDPNTGGIRLTLPLGNNMWNFGRGFALIYGEKENGGMFSHMTIMYAYALYSRGFVKEGYQVLQSVFHLCTKSENAQIYPGMPEYISSLGKGMYAYVTGSASWMIMTMLVQVFGIRGCAGDFVIEPKLVKKQFKNKREIEVTTTFSGRKLHIIYRNAEQLEYGEYLIGSVSVNGTKMDYLTGRNKLLINKDKFFEITKEKNINTIMLDLRQKK